MKEEDLRYSKSVAESGGGSELLLRVNIKVTSVGGYWIYPERINTSNAYCPNRVERRRATRYVAEQGNKLLRKRAVAILAEIRGARSN
jgi:hypothetical protein